MKKKPASLHFESIDSTSLFLLKNYRNLEDMTFVSADYQDAGCGRSGHIWKSESGKNLLFSLLILDKEFMKSFEAVSPVSAYTIIEVLKEYGLDNLSIKWPNDVFSGDKKIAGILLQSIVSNDLDCLVIGVGLNVNQTEFDSDFYHEPTSVRKELQEEIDLKELKEKIYQKFCENLKKLKEGYSFLDEIRKTDYLKGKEAFAQIDGRKQKVTVKGINEDYSLKVEANGLTVNINSGEISFHD